MIPKKSDNKYDINNYRPISQTPCLAKLFERMISGRLKSFLKVNNILISCQSGFRQNRQTKDNIFQLTQKVSETFNRKKKLCCIFFDIAAAFDKVWHKGLIYKLIQIKLPLYLVNFFIAFLWERKFRISLEGFNTEYYGITNGTPQGTVTSPILFNIFINDIPLNLKSNKSYSQLFADDLSYFHIYKKGEKAASKNINKHLKELEKWLSKWRLRMAHNKCNFLVFSNGNSNESEKIDLKLNGIKLKYNNCPTFLGIRFDNHLTFKNQITYLKETSIQRLNILKILAYKTLQCINKISLRIFIDLRTNNFTNKHEYASNNSKQRFENHIKKTNYD